MDKDKEVERSIWHACAGVTNVSSLFSPSSVYYFPQGHVETYSHSTTIKTLFSQFPPIKCKLLSTKFLADQATDEVFAHMVLRPEGKPSQTSTSHSIQQEEQISQQSISPTSQAKLFSGFIKPLKNCDLGGTSINIQCSGVDKVFPKEDMEVSVRDIHNHVWKFGHAYNNTCHYLTDGWGEFVSSKKLVAGDSLVFLKTRDGLFTLGIRRGHSVAGASEGFIYKLDDKIQRTGKSLCSVEALGEALGKALRDLEFEVVYYPSVCGSHFVEDSKRVDESVTSQWNVGMRVRKLGIEKNGLSRVWHEGIITSLTKNPLRWSKSSWKRMQVSWDDPQVEESTNPWEIQVVPTKKRKLEEFTLMGQKIVQVVAGNDD